MWNKFLCFLGWHTFVWKYEEGTVIFPKAPPPPNAKCEHCGVTFGDLYTAKNK